MTEFTNPKSIKFVEHRWRTEIEIVDADGTEHRFIASADAGYTEHDGIWFGTQQQYEENAP